MSAEEKRCDPIFLAMLKAKKIPAPIREFRFHQSRRWRFDYAWPEQMVALETEGGIWTRGRHTRGKGFSADMLKYSEAAIAGWCVIRVATAHLHSNLMLDLLTRALTRKER